MLTQERLRISYLFKRTGMALYLVLAVLVITAIIAGISLNFILSQSRLTHHTVSRTQAYYAARLGMNYAIEMLSNNDPAWPATSNYTRTICRKDCDKDEPDLPASINNITIEVGDPGSGLNGTRTLDVTVDYLFQQ